MGLRVRVEIAVGYRGDMALRVGLPGHAIRVVVTEAECLGVRVRRGGQPTRRDVRSGYYVAILSGFTEYNPFHLLSLAFINLPHAIFLNIKSEYDHKLPMNSAFHIR